MGQGLSIRPRAMAKEAIYGALHLLGLPRLKGRAAGTLTIVTYHSFGDVAEYPYMGRLPARRLAQQLAYFARTYDVVPLVEGLDRLKRGEAGTRPMLALTADDGYADNHSTLLPALRHHRLPATVFVATDYLDTGALPWPTEVNRILCGATRKPEGLETGGRAIKRRLAALPHAQRVAELEALREAFGAKPIPVIPSLDWDQVRALRDGGVSIGSHTIWHGWLDMLERGEITRELAGSRARIEEELGVPCTLLAYPNGNWNSLVAEVSREAGYRAAVTQDGGVNIEGAGDLMALKRIEMPFDERLGTIACRVAGMAI